MRRFNHARALVRDIIEDTTTSFHPDLKQWFCGAPGARIAEVEAELLRRVLPDLFGYHIVQLGNHYAQSVVGASRISHQLVLHLDTPTTDRAALVCRSDALPLEADTIDVLVMPHVLEFSNNPHGVLREAERVLIGEGHLVILGFNPWSWCGLWRALLAWRGLPPWRGRFLSLSRLRDWLGLLGLEIEWVSKASFVPPLSRPRVNQRLHFLESLGARCWPFFGNVYVVLAKKRVSAVTPLKSPWKSRRRLVTGSVAEPTTRCRSRARSSAGAEF